MISSAAFMPHQQPVIDGFEFAAAGAAKRGVCPLGDLPRLRDMLAVSAGEVAYELVGTRDDRDRPCLRLKVRGMLQLRCQRCLEALAFEVQTDETLVLVGTLAEVDAEPVDADAAEKVVAGKQMPVCDLIEDELILALPYAPRHENCGVRSSPDAANEKTSPFSGLQDLMGGKH